MSATARLIRACPAPEILAAFLDGTVASVEREGLEAHLVECAECRFVVASTVDERDEASTEPPAAPRRPGWRRRWAAAAGIAAAITLVVLWAPADRSARDGRLAVRLAEVVGPLRLIEARLSGGYLYGPAPAVFRGTTEDLVADEGRWEIFTVADEIRVAAEREATAEHLAALGSIHLLLGHLDVAVDRLAEANDVQPDDPVLLGDLAAAYFERGVQYQNEVDLVTGLETADRALDLDRTVVEAAFNRALLLEALARDHEAETAWLEVLELDDGSPWAGEAREHFDRLRRH